MHNISNNLFCKSYFWEEKVKVKGYIYIKHLIEKLLLRQEKFSSINKSATYLYVLICQLGDVENTGDGELQSVNF